MDREAIVNLIKKIPNKYFLPLTIGCMGLILFVYGFYTLVYQPQLRENNYSSNFSQPHSASVKQNGSSNSSSGEIKVDVEGAVASPGVYTISQDARAQDALIAAGGLSATADRAWVAQHLNLAVKLLDGTKIYIPSIGDRISEVRVQTAGGSTSSDSVLGAQSQQIDINIASASDLDALPGIGPATANKIVAGRPYASIQDLVTNKIVGAKEFEKIKGLIVAQ